MYISDFELKTGANKLLETSLSLLAPNGQKVCFFFEYKSGRLEKSWLTSIILC